MTARVVMKPCASPPNPVHIRELILTHRNGFKSHHSPVAAGATQVTPAPVRMFLRRCWTSTTFFSKRAMLRNLMSS